jgi:hypothetical protein
MYKLLLKFHINKKSITVKKIIKEINKKAIINAFSSPINDFLN